MFVSMTNRDDPRLDVDLMKPNCPCGEPSVPFLHAARPAVVLAEKTGRCGGVLPFQARRRLLGQSSPKRAFNLAISSFSAVISASIFQPASIGSAVPVTAITGLGDDTSPQSRCA